MEMGEYLERSQKTARFDLDYEHELSMVALGLAGEAGEVANYVKKHLFHGHTYSREKLVDELGDCLWYIARMCYTQKISLDEVAEFNLAKLAKRYPEGFSEEASIHRVE